MLLKAFIETTNRYRGSIELLRQYWNVAEKLAEEKITSWNLAEMRAFMVDMGGRGFPAVHHSPAYEQAYAPVYRVTARAFLEQLGWQAETV